MSTSSLHLVIQVTDKLHHLLPLAQSPSGTKVSFSKQDTHSFSFTWIPGLEEDSRNWGRVRKKTGEFCPFFVTDTQQGIWSHDCFTPTRDLILVVNYLHSWGGWGGTGNSVCVRTEDPSNRVDVCQTPFSAHVEKSERPLPVWNHSYTYHGQFFSQVPWDTFLSLCFSSVTKISLVSYQHDRNALMGCILPWRKEKMVHTWNIGQVMRMMPTTATISECPLSATWYTDNIFKLQNISKRRQTFPHFQTRTLKFREVK